LSALLQPAGARTLGRHTAQVHAVGRISAELRTHRICRPEHAQLVRAACMHDRSVLPRWHQDDRGPAHEHAGHHEPAPAAAYSRIPTWGSRERWVAITVPLAIAQHPEILARNNVSAALLRAAARVKSGYAWSNGRRCIVRPQTLASVLGVTERHAQNINRCLRELGLEKVVLVGRMLNQDERYACWRRGSRQRGLATEVALTIPIYLRVNLGKFTPPSGPHFPHSTHLPLGIHHGLAAEQEGAASPQHLPKSRRRAGEGGRLARELVLRVPWLASERPGRLAPTLMRFATAPVPWTAQDVIDSITAHGIRTQRGPITADTIRTRPAALLAAILRQLDPEVDHPSAPSFTGPVPTPPAPAAEPCGGPCCDGLGWLLPDPTEGESGPARPCPDCPPAVRSSTVYGGWAPGQVDEDGNPPF
jgi:hypothetical protein